MFIEIIQTIFERSNGIYLEKCEYLGGISEISLLCINEKHFPFVWYTISKHLHYFRPACSGRKRRLNDPHALTVAPSGV
jgi:hypothetical protein